MQKIAPTKQSLGLEIEKKKGKESQVEMVFDTDEAVYKESVEPVST